jgi:hypothetical protein
VVHLSSNVRFAGVKHGFASNIKSVDALLHGFDVTYASDTYFYNGDGVRVNEELESKYIHIDSCEASGFGDDGITTHHSRYLLLQTTILITQQVEVTITVLKSMMAHNT